MGSLVKFVLVYVVCEDVENGKIWWKFRKNAGRSKCLAEKAKLRVANDG